MSTRTVRVGLVVMLSLVISACSKKSERNANADAAQLGSGSADAASRSTDFSSAEELVRAYAATAVCLDRKRFILFPEQNDAAMREWYSTTPQCIRTVVTLTDGCGQVPVGGYCFVKATYAEQAEAVSYELLRTPSGFKIDWRSSVRYTPMTFTVYKVQRPKEPTLFRVSAKLDDYYPYDVRARRDALYSIELKYPTGGPGLRGFIQRATPDGKKLFDLLKNGGSKEVMVEIVPLGADADLVEIHRLAAESWRQYPEEK